MYWEFGYRSLGVPKLLLYCLSFVMHHLRFSLHRLPFPAARLLSPFHGPPASSTLPAVGLPFSSLYRPFHGVVRPSVEVHLSTPHHLIRYPGSHLFTGHAAPCTYHLSEKPRSRRQQRITVLPVLYWSYVSACTTSKSVARCTWYPFSANNPLV